MFAIAVLFVAAAAGGVAAVAGFGIGSLLTPLLAFRVDTKTAVAAVSVPHAIGTMIRFWRMRADLDRAVLWRFGLTSAAGGLSGALLHAWASSPALATVFGVLLVFAGATQLMGGAGEWRFHGWVAWLAGAASGLFGGLVGNQGGIRSAALLGFELRRDQFVATATAIALLVDVARMPVYLIAERSPVLDIWVWVVLSVIGVIVGTLLGGHVLDRVPENSFRRVVGVLLVVLGVATLFRRQA